MSGYGVNQELETPELLTELSVPRQSASSALVVKLRTRSEMQRDVDCTGLHVTTQLHVVEGDVGRKERGVVLEKLGYFVEVKDGAALKRPARHSADLRAHGFNSDFVDVKLFLLVEVENEVNCMRLFVDCSDCADDAIDIAVCTVKSVPRMNRCPDF